MIFIVVKWPIRPEFADRWPELSRSFTEQTRAEPGNKWFEWSRSLDDPTTYVLVEAFDDDAGEAHVTSDHFTTAKNELPQYLSDTPSVINVHVDGDGWSVLEEMSGR